MTLKTKFQSFFNFKNREVKITTLFLALSVVVISIMFIIVAYFWTASESKKLNEDLTLKQIDYIESQQEMIKKETERAVDYINYNINKTELILKNKLKSRVDQAYNIASNIYKENKNILSDTEIKKLITDALRPMRFDNAKSYCFIVSLEGYEVLYPVAPENEGKYLCNLQDKFGKYVVQEEINVVKSKGEGFVTGNWPSPISDTITSTTKLSYVKMFKPFNWYIGTGEYYSDFTKTVQSEVLTWLSHYRFGKQGYIFVNTYEGNALLMNGIIDKEQKNIWNLEDPNGVKVIQEERRAAKNPKGSFIYYSWRRLTDSVIVPKTSFVKGVSQWQWMVGAGIYIEEITNYIEIKEKAIKKSIYHDFLLIIIILSLVYILLFLLAFFISKKASKNINWFIKFFKTAIHNYNLIDTSKIAFSEFRVIADSANDMISELKMSEIRKQEKEAHYEKLFGSSPEAIVFVNNKNKVIKVNSSFTKLFGYTNSELLNCFLDDFIVPDELKEEALLYSKEIDDGKDKEIVVIRKSKKNEKIHVSIIGTPVKVGNSQIGTYIIYRDITEQKILEQHLSDAKNKAEESDRLKTSFLMNMSHEIRTPLNAIIGFSTILTSKKVDTETQKKYLNILMNSGNNLVEIIDNIVDLSKIQSLNLKINNTKINFNKLFDELLLEFRSIKNQRKLDDIAVLLNKEIQKKDLYILSDAKRIKQVFSNLLDNALKFTKTGTIEFGYTIENNMLNCYVKDTGIGIHEKDIDFIFDRFRQVDESSTRNYGGTGIGLALCKNLVDLLGGKIHVESKFNQGTTFSFTLPFDSIETETEPIVGIKNKNINWQNKKILIAEDDHTNFELLNTFLAKTKAKIYWAKDGKEVIEEIKQRSNFDIILMDINMPKMNGNEALVSLKNSGVKTPIVAQTAYATDDKINEILKLGYDDYILKPIMFDDLLKILSKFLD